MGVIIGFKRRRLLSGLLMVPLVLTLFGAESEMKPVTLPDVRISSLRMVRE